MRLLAIDPGNTESAWVVLRDGKIESFQKEANGQLLWRLQTRAFLDGPPFDLVAIEVIASYGMAVGREVFETCEWIGMFRHAARWAVIRRVYRAEVKMHLCHSMKAKDANIRQALIDKLGPPGKKKAPGPTYGISGDCWAALGVAVTTLETTKASDRTAQGAA